MRQERRGEGRWTGWGERSVAAGTGQQVALAGPRDGLKVAQGNASTGGGGPVPHNFIYRNGEGWRLAPP